MICKPLSLSLYGRFRCCNDTLGLWPQGVVAGAEIIHLKTEIKRKTNPTTANRFPSISPIKRRKHDAKRKSGS